MPLVSGPVNSLISKETEAAAKGPIYAALPFHLLTKGARFVFLETRSLAEQVFL